MKTRVIRVAPHTAWARWLPNTQPAAGYLTLQNPSTEVYTVVSVSSPDYEAASFQQMVTMGTEKVLTKVDTLTIAARGQIALDSGGYRVFLSKPKRLIAPGDNVCIKLTFSTGDTLAVRLPVRTLPDLY